MRTAWAFAAWLAAQGTPAPVLRPLVAVLVAVDRWRLR